MRWSQMSVRVQTLRRDLPVAHHRTWPTSPTARIAACGGLITASKRRMPYIPRLETVNVPPQSSAG